MATIVSLVLILIMATTSNFGLNLSSAASCDQAHFGACVFTFKEIVGIQNAHFDNGPDTVQMLYAVLFAENTHGLKKICHGLDALHTCLGDSNTTCLSISNLMQLGFSVADALSISIVDYQLVYMCGPGSTSFLNNTNMNCFVTTMVNQRDDVDLIFKDFAAGLSSDILNACKYGQVLVTAIRNLFTASCHNQAFGWQMGASFDYGISALFECSRPVR